MLNRLAQWSYVANLLVGDTLHWCFCPLAIVAISSHWLHSYHEGDYILLIVFLLSSISKSHLLYPVFLRQLFLHSQYPIMNHWVPKIFKKEIFADLNFLLDKQ